MPSIFITAPDPDYRVKGSRDPLGFQVIWQDTGRLIIPHVSTVSTTLKDFQTLALAWQCKMEKGMDDVQFEQFFMRWEQLLAYARKSMNDEERNTILGIDRVRKHWQEEALPISSSGTPVVLLENQRYTGIWGRYNSPFTKMINPESEVFSSIFYPKIQILENLPVLKKCQNQDAFKISKDELEPFRQLFRLTEEEREFWRSRILADNCIGEWQGQVDKKREAIREAALYELLAIIGEGASEGLMQKLQEIENTERLLCPLNRIFRYLQTRSFWSKSEIEDDSFIGKCRASSTYVQPSLFTRQVDKKRNLFSILNEPSNWGAVIGIAKVNSEVSDKRGGAAWVTVSSDSLDINHREGANGYTGFDPANHSDNDYFIGTYLRLYDALSAETYIP